MTRAAVLSSCTQTERAGSVLNKPLTWGNVDLVRRYSNRVDLQERLAEAQSRALHGQQEPDRHAAATASRVSRTWRVRDRLMDGDIEQIIAEFLAGTPKRVLAERYAVSFSTVKNILRQHGVRRP